MCLCVCVIYDISVCVQERKECKREGGTCTESNHPEKEEMVERDTRVRTLLFINLATWAILVVAVLVFIFFIFAAAVTTICCCL